jgi:hypothetical protein
VTAHEAFCQFLEISGLEYWVSTEADSYYTTYVVGKFQNRTDEELRFVEGTVTAKGYANFCAEAVFRPNGSLEGFYVWE